MNNKNLSPIQLKAVELLTVGESINKVAKLCKIDQSTLYLWRQQPYFKRELEHRKNEIYEEAVGSLRGIVVTATQQLSNILDSSETPPATKLRAIEFILSTIKPEPRKLDLLEAVKVLTENGAIAPEVLERISTSFETFQQELKNAFDLSVPGI